MGWERVKGASPGRGERRFESGDSYAPTGLRVSLRRGRSQGLRPGLNSCGPPGLKRMGCSCADLGHEILVEVQVGAALPSLEFVSQRRRIVQTTQRLNDGATVDRHGAVVHLVVHVVANQAFDVSVENQPYQLALLVDDRGP